jgi:hypothetical protein
MNAAETTGRVSWLPSFSGDGYSYGGGIVVTFGDIAIQVGEDTTGKRQALAVKIAAVNELYEALSEFEQEISGRFGADADMTDGLRAVVLKARGALEKAAPTEIPF